jgi:hypothetical protein
MSNYQNLAFFPLQVSLDPGYQTTSVSINAVFSPTAPLNPETGTRSICDSRSHNRDLMAQWQVAVWNALYDAAQTSYYANQQMLNAQIAALEAQINAVDTLTLRREESD